MSVDTSTGYTGTRTVPHLTLAARPGERRERAAQPEHGGRGRAHPHRPVRVHRDRGRGHHQAEDPGEFTARTLTARRTGPPTTTEVSAPQGARARNFPLSMSLQVSVQTPDPNVLDARPPTVCLPFSEHTQVTAAHPVSSLLHERHTCGRAGNYVLKESTIPLNGVELPGRSAVTGVLEDSREFFRDRASVAAVTVVRDVIARLDDGRDRKDQRVLHVQALLEAVCHGLLVLIEAIEV